MIEIPYKKIVNYRAATRFGKQTGILIEDMGVGIVRLIPTNTKDTRPPCSMQIPREHIQEIIDELSKFI